MGAVVRICLPGSVALNGKQVYRERVVGKPIAHGPIKILESFAYLRSGGDPRHEPYQASGGSK